MKNNNSLGQKHLVTIHFPEVLDETMASQTQKYVRQVANRIGVTTGRAFTSIFKTLSRKQRVGSQVVVGPHKIVVREGTVVVCEIPGTQSAVDSVVAVLKNGVRTAEKTNGNIKARKRAGFFTKNQLFPEIRC